MAIFDSIFIPKAGDGGRCSSFPENEYGRGCSTLFGSKQRRGFFLSVAKN